MIILYVFIYLCISSLFIDTINIKTRFEPNNDAKYKYPDSYIFLIMLLGPFCFFILKKLRKWRKTAYYKYRLETLKKWGENYYYFYNITKEEYFNEIKNIERLLKLKKIN